MEVHIRANAAFGSGNEIGTGNYADVDEQEHVNLTGLSIVPHATGDCL